MSKQSVRLGRLCAALSILGLALCTLASAQVTVKTEGDNKIIKTASYEAVVASDGCLTNLRIGGQEFLKSGIDISRGAYFHQGGTLKLGSVEQPADNTVTAKSDKASVKYEFAADSMTWTVSNLTDKGMSFFMVFDPAVNLMMKDNGEFARPPLSGNWPRTVWFRDKSRLEITGSRSLWGPWAGNTQVWDAGLQPNETRKIELKLGQASADEAAKIAAVPGQKTITKPGYEAVVGEDGCLTNLRINGQEFLKPGAGISRGAYLFQDGALKLSKIEAAGDSSISASSDLATIKYEFADSSMTWTAANLTAKPMLLFIVFDPKVNAVTDGKEWAKPAVANNWSDTTWFSGKSRLQIKGSTRLWGPWEGPHQVWEMAIPPKETRKVELATGTASDAEAAKIRELTGPKPEADITILSPRNLQVFQRRTRDEGAVIISGRVKPACDKVEVRLTGSGLSGALPGKWQPVAVSGRVQGFSAPLVTPAGGWYKLEVRALKGDTAVATAAVEKVGVGEVFVGAGQSNSTNCGQTRTQQTSGMVSSFSGADWRIADDPQPGAHDRSGGGSFWPAFGDAMYEKYRVPIGVAVTGHGGTSVNQWQPDGELFNWMMTRIWQLGPNGFRAVLWHQGEADVGMAPEEYAEKLGSTIKSSNAAAGWEFPWVVARVSYHNVEHTSWPNPRAAQKMLWDSGVALEGPDTDTLGSEYRDYDGKGIHFSPKGCKAHGQLWAEKVSAYLDKVLGQ